MSFRISTRFKIFLIAIAIIVAGQMVYSLYNVQYFQRGYVETLRGKCGKLGGYLREDVEYVLGLGIPLTKLIKLENTLKEIMTAIPELAFIEITDMDGYVLYYADHDSLERIPPGTRKSATLSRPQESRLARFGLNASDMDTHLPITGPPNGEQVGSIVLTLAPDLIIRQSLEILLDMLTVILTSLLITFEMLGFFVSYSISAPLESMVTEITWSMRRMAPLSGGIFLFMDELGNFISRFNAYILNYLRIIGPHISSQLFFPDVLKRAERDIDDLEARTLQLESDLPPEPVAALPLKEIRTTLAELREKTTSFSRNLLGLALTPASRAATAEEEPVRSVPYVFIRPLVFLFVMADGFCISFFPLFANTLYSPIAGLSREVVMGIPISLFMFFLATSMPVTGGLTDAVGWRRPLMIGIPLNAAGLLLTALSQNIWHLLIFRSITAVGFGMTYMACQQFIVDVTTPKRRATGMAAFLAAFFSGDICGTVVGGMLADRIGYRGVFLLAGSTALSAWLLALLIFRRNGQRNGTSRKPLSWFPFRKALTVIRDRDFAALVLFQAIPAKLILVGFLYYFVPVYLKHIGALQSNIGRVIMCYGILIVFTGPLISRFFDNDRHRPRIVALGGLLTGAAFLTFPLFQGMPALLGAVIALGLSHAFSVSAQSSLISETKIVQDIGSGTGMGLFRFWERTGNISGPILVGALIGWTGYENTVAILGGMSVSGSLIYLGLLALRHRRRGAA